MYEYRSSVVYLGVGGGANDGVAALQPRRWALDRSYIT